jgi:hypothetical protein
VNIYLDIDLNIDTLLLYIIVKSNKTQSIQINKSEWKTIGVKVRLSELHNLNRQLDRLGYTTLGDLVKDLIVGKITRLTDDQQIDIMKTNLQANGQITGLLGKPYDFYKQIDIEDFLTYLKSKYHEHTAKCYLSYFERYANVFFGLNPDVELFKLNPHKILDITISKKIW